MGDWLGTGTVAPQKRKYRTFKKAKRFSRGLFLKNQKEWFDYTKGKMPKKPKLPHDIPAKPSRVYQTSGWASWGDWLGTGFIANQKKKYWPFLKARKYVRKLKLKNQSEWKTYRKNKVNKTIENKLPRSPRDSYLKKGWKGWGDFLGNGYVATFRRKYPSFKKAKTIARKLKIFSRGQWRKASKIIYKHNLPSMPDRTYKKKGWSGWSNFFSSN